MRQNPSYGGWKRQINRRKRVPENRQKSERHTSSHYQESHKNYKLSHSICAKDLVQTYACPLLVDSVFVSPYAPYLVALVEHVVLVWSLKKNECLTFSLTYRCQLESSDNCFIQNTHRIQKVIKGPGEKNFKGGEIEHSSPRVNNKARMIK